MGRSRARESPTIPVDAGDRASGVLTIPPPSRVPMSMPGLELPGLLVTASATGRFAEITIEGYGDTTDAAPMIEWIARLDEAVRAAELREVLVDLRAASLGVSAGASILHLAVLAGRPAPYRLGVILRHGSGPSAVLAGALFDTGADVTLIG